MLDTDAAMLARYLDLIRSASKPQRLARALALSALARHVAWQGALRHSGQLGDAAVAERFVLQLYGPDAARRVATRLRDDPGLGVAGGCAKDGRAT